MSSSCLTMKSVCHLPILTLLLVSVIAESSSGADAVQFNRDIRPILTDVCFHCHGPDPGARKAGLRLDTEAGFFAPRIDKDGKQEPPTITKGQPDKSPLYQRLIATDEDDIMPPKKEHKDLKPEQIALVKKWIEQGAPWQPHWSFIKPERAPLPVVNNEKWMKNPVDRFILAKLQDAGLSPAPEADRPTLARRLSL
ncbi:MAG: c-type cytochrome domain-containing protein, partial [Verrucomicrobiaceae bacterium]